MFNVTTGKTKTTSNSPCNKATARLENNCIISFIEICLDTAFANICHYRTTMLAHILVPFFAGPHQPLGCPPYVVLAHTKTV